jgi:hypothetical protein
MTNPESQYPPRSIPLTYLQQNEQSSSTFSKYVIRYFNLHANHIFDEETIF